MLLRIPVNLTFAKTYSSFNSEIENRYFKRLNKGNIRRMEEEERRYFENKKKFA